ncbi:hypothetical protein AB5J62_22960 [Amycolatopsis sp. cg5]|uniref:hypothetical protein n=1 Tax=Amycolatopsis sp. cg5 TaxID=3238802 RepID=UPI003525E6BC
MAKITLIESDLRTAKALLGEVVEAFAAERQRNPTLGELLEVLGLSVPGNCEQLGSVPFPLVFRVKLKGGRRYEATPSERVAGLNDITFTEASELLAFLAERVAVSSGQPAEAGELASVLLQALRAAQLRLDDVSSGDVASLAVHAPKRIKAVRGDVVAIRSSESGHHFAVILTEGSTEVAVGLLSGVFKEPRLGPVGEYRAEHIPVFTGDALIANGKWPIIGHSEALLGLFPDPPEFYFRPSTSVSVGNRYGEHGAAISKGKEGRTVRLISRQEAVRIGLPDVTYRQSYDEELFERMLNEGHFAGGPLPGFWRDYPQE